MSQLASPPGKDGQAPKTILSPNLASTPTYPRSSPMASPIISPQSRQYRLPASPAGSVSTFRSAPSRKKVSEAIAAIKAKKSGSLRSPSPIPSPGAASFSRERASPATVQDENSTRSILKHLPMSPRTPGASLPGAVNKPSGTVSPVREPLSPVSTGSTHVQSNLTQSLLLNAFTSRVAAPDIPSLGVETKKHSNGKDSATDELKISVDLETDSTSDNSDDPVDPTVTEGIGAFIDSLQKNKEEKTEISKIVNPAVSSSTDESECMVEPETLAEIGEVIDSIVKKPKEAVDATLLTNSSSDDSSKGEDVPEETRAGIGAFIDSLQTKQVSEDEKKASDPPGDKISLYITSSEESAINSKDSEIIAETEEEIEKFVVNRENKQEEQKEATTAPDTEEIHGAVTDSLSLNLDVAKDSLETNTPDEMQSQVMDFAKNKSDVAFEVTDKLTVGSIQEASRGNLLKINFTLKQLMKLYEGDKEPLPEELNAIRLNAESLGIQSEVIEDLITQAAHPKAREIADLSEMTSFDDLELQRLLAEDETHEDDEEIRAFLTRFAHLTVGDDEGQETEEEETNVLDEKIAAYAKKIGQLYARGEVTDRVRQSMLEEARHNDVPEKLITDLFHDLLLKQAASSDSEEESPDDNMKTEPTTKSAHVAPPEGTTTEDLMVKLAAPEGSSLMEISKVNFIMKKLAELHEGDARPEKEEIDEIRRAAQRVNIPDETINDMIEYASLPPVIQSTLSEASTFDDDELEKALASDKFNVIKEYDESEDIEAYLKRYAHLARGGHFPQANIDSMGSFGKEAEGEEGVEYDAEFGYVKTELVPSEEEEWWEGKDLEGMESHEEDSEMYSEMSSKLALKESVEPESVEPKEEKDDCEDEDEEESTTMDDILGVSDTNDDESTGIDDILDKDSLDSQGQLDEVVSEESTESGESSESSEDESLSVNPWTSQDSDDMLSEIYEADPDDEDNEQPVQNEKFKTADLEVIEDETETSIIESAGDVSASSRGASEEESLEEQDRWWEDDDDDDDDDDGDEPSVASLAARLSSDNENDDDSASGSTEVKRKSDQKVGKEIEIEIFNEPEEENTKNHKPNRETQFKGREQKEIEDEDKEEEEEEAKVEIRDRYVRDPTGKPDWREREHDYVSSVRIKKYEEKMAKKAAEKAESKGMIEELEDMFENREKYQMKAQRALKQWKNPWNIDSKVTRTKNGKPIPLGGVAAAKAIRRWSPRIKKNRPCAIAQTWRMSYKKRTKPHPGYFNVDIYSLYGTSVVAGRKHILDGEPWENRDVKQYFLHEKSISFARNWFGDLRRERCNDPYREPVCRPESMEMPMDNVGDDEWDQDWYLTWQCKREMGALIAYSQSEDESVIEDTLSRVSSGTRYDESVASEEMDDNDDDDYISDDDSWEELPQCGSIHNVKLKIGERVSRVHHNHTSSLRRSRWRKKYFPRGTFPY